MSKAVRYGWVEGDGKGREYPVAADQYFAARSGKFVRVNSVGHVYLATTLGTQAYGWAETPKNADGKAAWKSSATAGADKVFVIYGPTNKFEMPVDKSVASANATLVGKGGNITQTAANATYGQVQYFAYRATVASTCLEVYDYDKTNQTVVVGIRPTKMSPV
jgi:hypothetical protein